MRQIQSISHSLQDKLAIETIKDFCHIKHGRERRGRSQTMTLESRLNQTALYQWWELRKPPIPQIKIWKHWWSSGMRWCLPLEASCLICHFSNDLSKEDPGFAFLVPAPIMEKGTAEHISLGLSNPLTPLCKALRNFIPLPPVLTAELWNWLWQN